MKIRALVLSIPVLALTLAAVSVPGPAAADAGTEVERIERGNLVIEGIPEIPSAVSERMRRYSNTRSAGFAGWHPDGEGILIRTRFGETSQVHWVREPGGARRQLTFFDEPVGAASPAPASGADGFLFSKDVGGSEFYQVFYYDLDSYDYRMLSDGESRNGSAVWSNAGDRVAYYSTRRNGRDWDIYVRGVAPGAEERRVLEVEGSWVVADWSPGDETLLLVDYVSANEAHPWLLDLDSGELTAFNPQEGKVAYGGLAFSRDGAGVYYVADEDSEFMHLRYRDLDGGNPRVLTADIPWNIGSLALSHDGTKVAFTANEDGIAKLHLRDLESNEDLPLPELPVGQVFGLDFSADDSQLGLYLVNPRTPGDVYSVDLAARRLDRWTFSEAGGLDTETFTVPELVRYPTFDRVGGEPREIPAFYYRPVGEGPFPVLINIHGGPEGQARPFFNPTTQYYVGELGIAVIYPNVRGSAGYGKSYLLLDNGMKREDSVKDIGALLDWIERRPELDEGRVAVVGGSYGGYMVLSALTHYDDRLKAGVDIVGISNFVTFLENTQDYRRDMRRAEYGDERDPEMRAHLEEISPTNNAEKITQPLLIVQGANDPRVPASESEQMVDEIRENGGEVWYLLAKDEGHGFRKKSNRDYFTDATALFLEQHLVADGDGSGGERAGTAEAAGR